MKDYTRVYLIRHGHLVNSHTGVFNGHTDIELSPEGIAQTIVVAESFRDKSISAIYSSDLRRCREGAEIIAAPHGLKVMPGKALDVWHKWIADPVSTSPPGGETLRDIQRRVIKELEVIIGRHVGEEIILFTHAGVNRIIICHAVNLAIENCFSIQQDFCRVNIIDFYEQAAVVRLINGS